MSQTNDRLRAKFKDDGEASSILELKGWIEKDVGWWIPPNNDYERILSEDEDDAITYLIEEWDHAILVKK